MTSSPPPAFARSIAGLSLAVLAVLTLASCGAGDGPDDDTVGAPAPAYTAGRVAPLPGEVVDRGTDETPDAEEALVELDLDDGGTAALWIDPQDIARVLVQYSDPDDPDAWTEPALVFAAGDGCLTMDADSAGDTVAVGLGCYETDAFIQQAPDQGVALVSDDYATWDELEVGESIPVPDVSDDGTEVVFRNEVYQDRVDATWTSGEGF